jgi:hypothetical protein
LASNEVYDDIEIVVQEQKMIGVVDIGFALPHHRLKSNFQRDCYDPLPLLPTLFPMSNTTYLIVR